MPNNDVRFIAADDSRPYSHATVVGPWIFTKGTAGHHPETGFSADIREQTAQCMKNLAEILEASGATFADVVKVNVYLVNVQQDYDAVNEVYLKAMGGNKPARCCIGVPALPTPNENMKIEMVAYKG